MAHMTHARSMAHMTHTPRSACLLPAACPMAHMTHAARPAAWEGGRVGPPQRASGYGAFADNFYFFGIVAAMFQSLPYEPRRVQATEARLERIYAVAKRGLKGDSLAIAAGLLPEEFNQLAQLDPLVNLAAQKGRADAEMELSEVLYKAAMAGDTKAAETILKHKCDWVAKQQIEVNQTISITAALQAAQQRVINYADDDLLGGGRTSLNGEVVDARVIE